MLETYGHSTFTLYVMKKNVSFWFFYFLLTSSFGQELFVSTVGSDSNTGSFSHPFLTIEKAQQVARTLIPTMNQDVIVTIMDGSYHLNQTLTFTANDSGLNGFRVIYRAYNRGNVEINGGKSITNWQLHDSTNNIFKTQLVTNLNVRNFFVNGKRAQRARSIDGSGWSTDLPNKRYNCPTSVQNWNENSDLEVAVSVEWKHHKIPIASVSNNIATVDQAFHNINIYAGFPSTEPTYIENAYELLDSPSEWYYSKITGVFYYKPRPGESMSTAHSLLAMLERLVTVNGVSNMVFDGISFVSTTRLKTNSEGYHCGQGDMDMSQVAMEAAVYVNQTRNTLFKSCQFKNLGTSGIRLHSGCKDNMIFNCQFENISGTAISISTPSYTSLQNITAQNLVENNWVYNNIIRNVGVEYEGSVGIMLGNGTRFYITNNDISDVNYSGISLGWAWNNSITITENSVIAYNRVDNVMKTLNDGGGIYTSSNMPGTHIRNNYISNVHNNYALYPDGGTSNVNWNNNVIKNSVYLWMYMWSNDCLNNSIQGNFTENPNKIFNGTNTVIANNSIITNDDWPLSATISMNLAGLLPNPVGDNLGTFGSIGNMFWGVDSTSQSIESRFWVKFGSQMTALDNLNGKTILPIPTSTAGTITFYQNDWYGSDGLFWYKLNNPVVTSDLFPQGLSSKTGEIIALGGHIFGFNGTRWCQLDELIGVPKVFNRIPPLVTSTPELFDPNSSDVQLNVSNGAWSGLSSTTVFSYQWFYNNVEIVGASSNSLSIPSIQPGIYFCSISVSDGITTVSAISNQFTVSLDPPINIIAPSIENFAGLLKVTSKGTLQNAGNGLFNYQWQKNGVNIPSAIGENYLVPITDYNNIFTCLLIATNNAGASTMVSNEILVKFPIDNLSVNAQVAYSTRKLSTNALFALQVRRGLDNAVLNIGFDLYGNLDEIALLNFVGTGNGFISIWYDQSGNNRHAIQTTASNQATIVNTGVVIKQNKRPTLKGNSGTVFYSISSLPSTVNYTGIAVFRKTTENVDFNGFSNSSNQQLIRVGSDQRVYTYYGSTQGVGITLPMSENLTIVSLTRQEASGANSIVSTYRNAILKNSFVATSESIILNRLGAPWGSNWGGWYSEAIWFNSHLNETDRLNIESNQLKYYDIHY